MGNYVIITPARNEEAFLDKTINSVANQTILPLKWIVVNDGSSDRTGEIVNKCKARTKFVELINVERSGGRHFGNKVKAFQLGLDRVHSLAYDYIGNLDADISLQHNYYERILSEFENDSRLGVAGGMVSSNIDGRFVSQGVALDSAAGAVQLFRRQCFEQIGGYRALPLGGIDAAAEIMARKTGWKVRTFPDLRVLEHRRTGTALTRPLSSRVKEGRRSYSLGYGFLFFFMRCVYRSMEKPRVLGSAASLLGYLSALINRDRVVLAPDIVGHLRTEQREKILRLFNRKS